MRLKRNSNTFKLLKILATVGLIAVSLTSPFAGTKIVEGAIKGYLEKKIIRRERFLKDLKRLQSRKLLDYREWPDGKVELTITKFGRKIMLAYKIDEITLKRPEKWDGLWRLIMFDIPHSQKKARDAFRQKLKDLRFYPLQKSVFITPYPCEDDIDFLGSFFNVRHCVLILYVNRFEGEEKLRYYFKL